MTRIVAIVREMLPTTDLVIKSAMRAAIGGCAILTARHAPSAAAQWIDFGGRMFVMLAIFGLFGHAEGVFAKHAASKVKTEAGRAGWALVMLAVIVVSLFTLPSRRDEIEDENGIG